LETIHDRECQTKGPRNKKRLLQQLVKSKIHIFLTDIQWILSKFEPNILFLGLLGHQLAVKKILKKKIIISGQNLTYILGADRREQERIDIVDSM